MSEVKGKLVTCDRCGATTFCKYIGQGNADGGYTIWDKFEPLPEGWGYSSAIHATLCPDCYFEYTSMVAKFMEVDDETCENKAKEPNT